MEIKHLKTYLDADFLTETALLLKHHTKKFVAALLLTLACIFGIMYFVHKNHAEQQRLLQKYIVAQSKVSQQENATALKMFQEVYNNSKGTLEAMALMSITDLLMQDKQYETVKALIADIPTLKQKPETFTILYSKALNVVLQLQKHQAISKEEEKLFETFTEHLGKLSIPNEFNAHKQTLLFAFSNDFPRDLSKLKDNELTQVLKIIEANRK